VMIVCYMLHVICYLLYVICVDPWFPGTLRGNMVNYLFNI